MLVSSFLSYKNRIVLITINRRQHFFDMFQPGTQNRTGNDRLSLLHIFLELQSKSDSVFLWLPRK